MIVCGVGLPLQNYVLRKVFL